MRSFSIKKTETETTAIDLQVIMVQLLFNLPDRDARIQCRTQSVRILHKCNCNLIIDANERFGNDSKIFRFKNISIR